jgi:hypothetical protein
LDHLGNEEMFSFDPSVHVLQEPSSQYPLHPYPVPKLNAASPSPPNLNPFTLLSDDPVESYDDSPLTLELQK